MKKILIDLYKVKNEYSGLGQFSYQFARHLSEHHSHEFEFHFLVPRGIEFEFSPLIKLKRASLLYRFWKTSHEQYDLWHSLHQFHKYSPPKTFKHLLTIHDLNYQKEKDAAKQTKYALKMQAELDSADFLTSISNYTKSQILKSFPEDKTPIEVIHNGVDLLPETAPTRPRVQVGDKFFFSISLFTRKKNFEVLLPMMTHFPKYKLVLAGNHDTDYGRTIKQKISDLGLEKRIVLTGKIPTSEKIYYMKLCNAFLFPSLAEGFGMPPVEAMQFGKPVFLSDSSSLPEIGGDAAYYFPDFDPKNMADYIKYELENFDLDVYSNAQRVQAQAAKFTWTNSMNKYLDLYRRLTA
jgi:glycosyltransferase involved in cell wall biosynthesis